MTSVLQDAYRACYLTHCELALALRRQYCHLSHAFHQSLLQHVMLLHQGCNISKHQAFSPTERFAHASESVSADVDAHPAG